MRIELSLPVLITVFRVGQKHGKLYSYASMNKILELLDEKLGIKMSRRTLSRRFRNLGDEGLMTSKRRTTNDPVKGYMFKSTLRTISNKGYKVMNNFGISCYEWLGERNKKSKKPKRVNANIAPNLSPPRECLPGEPKCNSAHLAPELPALSDRLSEEQKYNSESDEVAVPKREDAISKADMRRIREEDKLKRSNIPKPYD